MDIVRLVWDATLGYDRRRQLRRAGARIYYFGLSRHCPCCGARVRSFQTYGLIPRIEARCPVCGSLERHRLIYLYLTRKTDLFDGRPKKMLHIAPEPQLSRLFRGTSSLDYLSADLMSPGAMVRMDITDIRYSDESFDVIFCSHVLEHIPDDRKAMRELHRVLKAGGWAILQVPVFPERTFEDPTVTSPEERERLFGQSDHVRKYGPDYVERLREAGFVVSVDRLVRELGEATIRRFGLRRDHNIYLCRKDVSAMDPQRRPALEHEQPSSRS